MRDGLKMKYFVLNPNKFNAHGAASRCALLTYAKQISPYNPDLAIDLKQWISDILMRDLKESAEK